MKKTLVFTLILTLMLSVVSFVSATETTEPAKVVSTIETEEITVEEGGTVSVVVNFSAPVRSGTVFVKYAADVLGKPSMPAELADASLKKEDGASTEGYTGFTFTGLTEGTSKVTFVFKTAEKAKAGDTTTVVASGKVIDMNAVASTDFAGTKTVNVIAKTPADDPVIDDPANTPGSDPADTGNGNTTPADPSSEGNTPADNNTNSEEPKATEEKPTKYPQTGVNVAVVAGTVVLAIVAGYVVTKRTK